MPTGVYERRPREPKPTSAPSPAAPASTIEDTAPAKRRRKPTTGEGRHLAVGVPTGIVAYYDDVAVGWDVATSTTMVWALRLAGATVDRKGSVEGRTLIGTAVPVQLRVPMSIGTWLDEIATATGRSVSDVVLGLLGWCSEGSSLCRRGRPPPLRRTRRRGS